ncbi:phosphotransferase family protein [Cellulomonas composti]|uniref:Phosphotransferase n=1 Tax=Cellulomonas composti TaxID=266130 RepID=A0A511JF51_9CELL|nr:aminoglycoside phosphotransferase family protein [Cellulomonas composti]GEL96429.1 phosphotransferase [Cellulomonas composti]
MDVTREALTRLVGPVGELADAARLEGGMFAETWSVTLADGRRVVVKIAPSDSDRLLSHEHDLLRTEAMVYELAQHHAGLLMPRPLHVDVSREVVPGDVLVATFLAGTPWESVGFGAHDEDARTARAEADLAALLGRLGAVTGETFGYPQSPALRGPTWRGAFTAMVEALLADAVRWDVAVPADRFRAALTQHGTTLDEVRVPRLVHTDLWPGNLFVDAATGALVGVIDPERALWGDPLLELVGADPMHTGLWRRLAPAGVDEPSARVRLALYRAWLALVMIVEVAPRTYTGDWLTDYDAANRTRLDEALTELGT